MNSCDDIIHAEELCALALSILHPWPIPAEEAFTILRAGRKKHTPSGSDIAYMREVGYTWKEIASITGKCNPHSTYSKYMKRLKTKGATNGSSTKNEKDGSK